MDERQDEFELTPPETNDDNMVNDDEPRIEIDFSRTSSERDADISALIIVVDKSGFFDIDGIPGFSGAPLSGIGQLSDISVTAGVPVAVTPESLGIASSGSVFSIQEALSLASQLEDRFIPGGATA